MTIKDSILMKISYRRFWSKNLSRFGPNFHLLGKFLRVKPTGLPRRRGVATGPVGPVSTGPLFGQSEIFFSFAKVKIVTIHYKIRASALCIT